MCCFWSAQCELCRFVWHSVELCGCCCSAQNVYCARVVRHTTCSVPFPFLTRQLVSCTRLCVPDSRRGMNHDSRTSHVSILSPKKEEKKKEGVRVWEREVVTSSLSIPQGSLGFGEVVIPFLLLSLANPKLVFFSLGGSGEGGGVRGEGGGNQKLVWGLGLLPPFHLLPRVRFLFFLFSLFSLFKLIGGILQGSE